jgi:glycolate oxidase
MSAFEELHAACPTLTLRSSSTALDEASLDALRPTRGRLDLERERRLPLVVAEPASAADVAALLRWASAGHVPVVARGGGSGLMGGAAVLAPAIVIDLRRLDAIAVDADACLVHAGAGATLARVDEALAPHGLMLGHDPWTVGVATVGGALSTNGLGYLGARAGSMGTQLQALEAALADGSVVRTRSSPARSVGLDLARLLVGTEGTLGVITEATLAVLPRPEERVVRAFELAAFEDAVRAAVLFRRCGVRPVCLEAAAGGLPSGPASLLLVFDDLRGAAALHAARASEIVAELGGRARPDAEAEAQWRDRHAIAERWAARRGSPPPGSGDAFDYAHLGVPLDGIDTVRAVAHAFVRRYHLRLVEEGLWHWPELYSLVVAGTDGGADGVRATIDAVCRAAQDAGGTMEYCHGVGWKLAHLAEREHGHAGLDALRRVKAALDPAGILNPGKGGL